MAVGRGRYWQLSAYYFFHFATLGVLLPYLALYLAAIGFSPLEIGTVFAISLGTKIVAPNLWAWISDRSTAYMPLVRGAAAAATLSLLALLWVRSFAAVAVTLLVFSFFWNAILPQMEATTMNHLGGEGARYGRVRLWGSVGFIAAVGLLGVLIQRVGSAIVVPALLLSAAGITAATIVIRDGGGTRRKEREAAALGALLRSPGVIALFAAFLLMQASHAPYYSFFTLYLKQHQVQTDLVGLLWVVGVVAEIVLFLFSHRLLGRFGLRSVFLGCFALTALRWLLVMLFPALLPVVLAAQTLHAFSFGAYHAAAIHWIHRNFSGPVQHRGQALYNSISFGVGGSIGSYVSGLLWERAGAVSIWWFAIAAALLALLLVALAPRTVKATVE